MNKKIVALIESPFQALGLVELILKREIEAGFIKLIINSRKASSESNERIIENVFKYFEFEFSSVMVLDVDGNFSGVIKKTEKLKRLSIEIFSKKGRKNI